MKILTNVLVFIATNIDDLLILTLFFGFNVISKKRRDIIIGQFLGMGFLIGLSLVVLFGVQKIDLISLRWLGIVPIFMGVKYFIGKKGVEKESERRESKEHHLIIQLFLLTVMNGMDNVGAYVPLFGSLTKRGLVSCIVIFLLMTGIWCILAINITKLKYVKEKLFIAQKWLLPIVLIYMGIAIILQL